MKIHRILPALLSLIAVSAFAACPVEDLAKTAAAQPEAQRASYTDAFIKAIESEKSLTAEQQLHLLWLANDLSSTDEQRARILKMAGTINSSMVRPLIFEFRSDENVRKAFADARDASNKLLLKGKPVPKGNYLPEVYGSNPYDARYDFDKWEDPHGFIGHYVDDKQGLSIDVIAKPANNFHARLWIGNATAPVELVGFIEAADTLRLIGPGVDATLTARGSMAMKAPQAATLNRVAIGKSCDKPIPEGAVVLLDKNSKDLSGFRPLTSKGGTWELHSDGVIESRPPKAGSLKTAGAYMDMQLYVEFRIPYNAEALGQMRGNSGVIIGESLYEVQILDSFGLDPKNNEAGGIYKVSAPSKNMAAPPLEWQSYLIDFTAPRYDASGKKTQNARITVWHNGVKVQDNVEIPAKTSDLKPDIMKEAKPVSFQEHSNRIQFRNIWVLPKSK